MITMKQVVHKKRDETVGVNEQMRLNKDPFGIPFS